MELTMNLPSRPATAFPPSYESAKAALRRCESLSELQDWRDRALAMSAYARVAKDPELLCVAVRIRARATRRIGELLLQIEPRPGARTDLEPQDASVPRLTREQAAKAAGLSERDRKVALRIASIPEAEFEELVEDAHLRTCEAIAKFGLRPREPRKPVEPEGELSAEHWMDRCEALQLSFAAAVDRAHDAIDQLSALDSKPRPAGARFLLSPDFCAAVDRMRAMVSFLETAMRRASSADG